MGKVSNQNTKSSLTNWIMGYTTYFEGFFTLNDRLFDSQVLYLLEFAKTRRVKRDIAQLHDVPDPAREAVGLPLGAEGGYFVNQRWDCDTGEASIVDYNLPPQGQPGLWCQWVPNHDGSGIEWDGGEKFYNYLAWLQYITQHFLAPWGYQLNGEVMWRGEENSDRGKIIIQENQLIFPEGDFLTEATTPILMPPDVFRGYEAVKAADPTSFWSWLAVVRMAQKLGYPETATWIEANLHEYCAGISKGFAPRHREP